MTTMRIASIGLELGTSVSHDPDVDATWYGFMSNGSGPMVTVRVERMWDEGGLMGMEEVPGGYVYCARITCKAVSVESTFWRSVDDAWEQAREEADLEAPRLAGELRVLEYAEAQRRRKAAAIEEAEGDL